MYKFEPWFILYMYRNNVTKLSCHLAIIQNSGSKSTLCVYEQKVTSMYPPYTFILVIPPFAATANVLGEF